MGQVLVNDTSLSAIGDLIRDNINPVTEEVYVRSLTLSRYISQGGAVDGLVGDFTFTNITPKPTYLKFVPYTSAPRYFNDYVKDENENRILLSSTTDFIVPAEYSKYYFDRFPMTSSGQSYQITAYALDANKQYIRGTSSSDSTLLTVDKVWKPSQMASALSDIIDELKGGSGASPLGNFRTALLNSFLIGYNSGTDVSAYITDVDKIIVLMVYDSRNDSVFLGCPSLRPVQTASTGVKWLPLSKGMRGNYSSYYWNTDTNYGVAIINGQTYGYYTGSSAGSTNVVSDSDYSRAFLLYTV